MTANLDPATRVVGFGYGGWTANAGVASSSGTPVARGVSAPRDMTWSWLMAPTAAQAGPLAEEYPSADFAAAKSVVPTSRIAFMLLAVMAPTGIQTRP